MGRLLLVITSIFAFCSGGVMVEGMNTNDIFKDQGARALCEAAAKGNIKEIDRHIDSGVDVNVRGKNDITPLFCAAKTSNKKGFKRLLERGADPNIQMANGDSVTLLVSGSEDDWYLEMVLKHGGNPDVYNKDAGFDVAPIFRAIGNLKLNQLEMLIKSGCNINIEDQAGITPLLYAAMINQWHMVLLLLKSGAKCDEKNKSCVKFMKLLKERNNLLPKGMADRRKVIEWLEKNRGVVFEPDLVR